MEVHSMHDLTSRCIVVIGGQGLIGRNIVSHLIDLGATVISADSAIQSKGFSVVGGRRLYSVPCDITSKDCLVELIRDVEEKCGTVSGLVNCAYPRGKNYGRPFEEVDYQDFCETVSMHLGGYFQTCQVFAEYFKGQGGGVIVQFSSVYGLIAPRFAIYRGTTMTTPVEYATIKSAIIHLTRYVAAYYAGCNVRCNCIAPGGVLDNQPESFISSYKKHCLGKGMLNSTDLNGTVSFLLSSLSQCINGQCITVDDGFSL